MKQLIKKSAEASVKICRIIGDDYRNNDGILSPKSLEAILNIYAEDELTMSYFESVEAMKEFFTEQLSMKSSLMVGSNSAYEMFCIENLFDAFDSQLTAEDRKEIKEHCKTI